MDVERVLAAVDGYREEEKAASEDLVSAGHEDAPNYGYWNRQYNQRMKKVTDKLLAELRQAIQ